MSSDNNTENNKQPLTREQIYAELNAHRAEQVKQLRAKSKWWEFVFNPDHRPYNRFIYATMTVVAGYLLFFKQFDNEEKTVVGDVS